MYYIYRDDVGDSSSCRSISVLFVLLDCSTVLLNDLN